MEKICRHCGGSIIMEKLWKIYGIFVEKQIWRNCGKLTHWKITDWKIPKTRYNGVVREPTEGMEKCFGKLQTGQALKAARRY